MTGADDVALDELRRIRDLAPPTDPTSAGCATAGVAIVAMVLIPFAGSGLDLSGRVMGGLGLALGIVAVAGAVVGFFGGGLVRRRERARLETAVAAVLDAHGRGAAAERTRGAVRLLEACYAPRGPGTALVADPAEVAGRLGPALPHVLEVERLLVARGEIDPILTARSSP